MRQARPQPRGTLHDAGERADDGPVMVIDTYLPKPGLRAAFIAQLADEIHRSQRPARGDACGSRVYRTLDGEAVVVVTEFASHAEKLRWRASETSCFSRVARWLITTATNRKSARLTTSCGSLIRRL